MFISDLNFKCIILLKITIFMKCHNIIYLLLMVSFQEEYFYARQASQPTFPTPFYIHSFVSRGHPPPAGCVFASSCTNFYSSSSTYNNFISRQK